MSQASAPPPDYPRARDLGGGVIQLDTLHHGQPGTIAAFALRLPGGGFALVESGPSVARTATEAALESAGLDLRDLRFVLLTHVHLDHAGAAAALAGPVGAPVYVHRIGAPHVADPSRLMASAGRVYGDKLDFLWGSMQPLDRHLVRPVEGGETLDLGGLKAQVIYTPGHASHHVSYLLPDDGTLFTGDSAGILLQGSGLIRPALPPPELDLEACDESLARMIETAPSRLILTHFGVVTDPLPHLREVGERNRQWEAAVLEGLAAGEDDEALTGRMIRLEDAEMEAAGTPPGIAARLKLTSDAQMTVTGLKRYLTKKHPERIEEARRALNPSVAEPGGTGVRFPLGRTARVAVLASGTGSNLASLVAAFPPAGTGLASVVVAVSDKPDAPALDRARGAGVRAEAVPWTSRREFEESLLRLLEEERVDLVCLAGFMRLLSKGLTERLAGRILNIHPSLLPEFRGLEPVERALEAGVGETGCTVHYVDAGMDTGPVVLQRRVPVLPGDDASALTKRVQEQEHLAYPEAVRAVLEGRA